MSIRLRNLMEMLRILLKYARRGGLILFRRCDTIKALEFKVSSVPGQTVKRERGENPRQSPLLYGRRKRICHWAFRPRRPASRMKPSQKTCLKPNSSFRERMMAVWGEVCAFELPFFLVWKDGFVFRAGLFRVLLCKKDAGPACACTSYTKAVFFM